MYVCPDPKCKQEFEWKGAALDHLDLAHNIGIEPNVRWAAMSPSGFQRLLDETWTRRPRPSSQDEPSPTLDLQPSATVPLADAGDVVSEIASAAGSFLPADDEPTLENVGALETGGGDFGGGGSSGDFSDAPDSSESVDSGASNSGSSDGGDF